MLETFLAKLHGNRSKRGYGSINSRWYGEHVLRSPDNLIWHVEFGYNNVFFVHSSGFAAEWWNNIWDWYVFGRFLNFAWCCKGFWSQRLWTRTSMIVCQIHLLHASHLQVNLRRFWCNFVFLDVHDVFDNWFDSFFNNKLKPIFLPSCIYVFWKLHVVLQQLHGREECFWNFWDGFGTFEVNSAHVNSPQWKWTTVWMWMDENLFFVFRCHCQDGKAETRTTQHSAWCMTDN